MLVEQPVEDLPGFGRHLEGNAQGAMHLRPVEEVDERKRAAGVDLVGDADAHALAAQRRGELY